MPDGEVLTDLPAATAPRRARTDVQLEHEQHVSPKRLRHYLCRLPRRAATRTPDNYSVQSIVRHETLSFEGVDSTSQRNRQGSAPLIAAA